MVRHEAEEDGGVEADLRGAELIRGERCRTQIIF